MVVKFYQLRSPILPTSVLHLTDFGLFLTDFDLLLTDFDLLLTDSALHSVNFIKV